MFYKIKDTIKKAGHGSQIDNLVFSLDLRGGKTIGGETIAGNIEEEEFKRLNLYVNKTNGEFNLTNQQDFGQCRFDEFLEEKGFFGEECGEQGQYLDHELIRKEMKENIAKKYEIYSLSEILEPFIYG